jgi:hypothetical protein
VLANRRVFKDAACRDVDPRPVPSAPPSDYPQFGKNVIIAKDRNAQVTFDPSEKPLPRINPPPNADSALRHLPC